MVHQQHLLLTSMGVPTVMAAGRGILLGLQMLGQVVGATILGLLVLGMVIQVGGGLWMMTLEMPADG